MAGAMGPAELQQQQQQHQQYMMQQQQHPRMSAHPYQQVSCQSFMNL